MLSCFAKNNKIALVTNIAAQTSEGVKHIENVIFDSNGMVVSIYDKVHLFPTEKFIFTPGTIAPTVFELFGRSFGQFICFEGFYPTLQSPADWSQMESLVSQGAEIFVWPVGGTGSVQAMINQAEKIAVGFDVPVFATQLAQAIDHGSPSVALIDENGYKLYAWSDAVMDLDSLKVAGYTAEPYVRYVTI